MQILSSFLAPKPRDPRPAMDVRLIGPRVVLRLPLPSDWSSWRALRRLSHDFLKPWEPAWPPEGLSRVFFDGLLRRQIREWRQGIGYAFMIFLRNNNPSASSSGEGNLIGGIGLNDVRRGIAQKATLGYWIGQPFTGQGLMTEAAELVCNFSFRDLTLHRVEASCLPNNEPSKHLLQRLGFAEEGYAKSYLRIDGAWQDHILWGKIET